MRENSDAGFSLAEVLVSLLVLSFVSAALVATFGQGVLGYKKLDDTYDRQLRLIEMTALFEGIGETEYLTARYSEDISELELSGARRIFINEQGEQWSVFFEGAGSGAQVLYVSKMPLRINYQFGEPSQLALEQKKAEDWKALVKVAVLVTTSPECQFDVVARRCR